MHAYKTIHAIPLDGCRRRIVSESGCSGVDVLVSRVLGVKNAQSMSASKASTTDC